MGNEMPVRRDDSSLDATMRRISPFLALRWRVPLTFGCPSAAVYRPDAARFVRQHRLDWGPFNSKLKSGSRAADDRRVCVVVSAAPANSVTWLPCPACLESVRSVSTLGL
jgi:hypothetical protein